RPRFRVALVFPRPAILRSVEDRNDRHLARSLIDFIHDDVWQPDDHPTRKFPVCGQGVPCTAALPGERHNGYVRQPLLPPVDFASRCTRECFRYPAERAADIELS